MAVGDISGTAGSNATTIGDEQSARDANGWKAAAEKKLLNLNTSNSEILDFIMAEMQSGENSAAKQQAITFLLSTRTQMITMISNVLRQIADGGNQIIRNIRL